MALADSVTAYVTAALSGAAEGPPEAARQETLDAAAELGRRLLARFQEPAAGGAGLRGPLVYLTADPESARARKAVRQQVRRMLAADSRLATEADQMVAGLLTEVTGAGDGEALADLGDLLGQLDDTAGAEAAFRQAAGLGSAQAVVSLGHLRMSRRDVAGARAVYQEAIESGPSEAALAATLELGRLLRRHDRDPAAAEAAWQQVADSGHPEWGAAALNCLASRTGRPDQPAARPARRTGSARRAPAGPPRRRPLHGRLCPEGPGWVLDQQGDISAARAALIDLIRTTEDPQSRRFATADLRRLPAPGQ